MFGLEMCQGVTLDMTTVPDQLRLRPSLGLPPIAEHDLAPSALEFEKRLDRYHERKRKQSFLRLGLIYALTKLAQETLSLANYLDRPWNRRARAFAKRLSRK
jgi:hypothetical protein